MAVIERHWLRFFQYGIDRCVCLVFRRGARVKDAIGNFVRKEMRIDANGASLFCLILDNGIGQRSLCTECEKLMNGLCAHSVFLLRLRNTIAIVRHWTGEIRELPCSIADPAWNFVEECRKTFGIQSVQFRILFTRGDEPIVIVESLPLCCQEWDGELFYIFPKEIECEMWDILSAAILLNATAMNPLSIALCRWVVNDANAIERAVVPPEAKYIASRFKTNGAFVFVSLAGVSIVGVDREEIPIDEIKAIRIKDMSAEISTKSGRLNIPLDRPIAFFHAVAREIMEARDKSSSHESPLEVSFYTVCIFILIEVALSLFSLIIKHR